MWVIYEVSMVRPPWSGFTVGDGNPWELFGVSPLGLGPSDCVWMVPGTVDPDVD